MIIFNPLQHKCYKYLRNFYDNGESTSVPFYKSVKSKEVRESHSWLDVDWNWASDFPSGKSHSWRGTFPIRSGLPYSRPW